MVKIKTPSRSSMRVGVAWYQPDQRQKLLAVSVDKDKLEETYEEWVQDAERVIKELRRQGLYIVKVNVNVEELVAWCQEKKIPVNGEARSRYANCWATHAWISEGVGYDRRIFDQCFPR